MNRSNSRAVKGELALDNLCRELVASLTGVARVAVASTPAADVGASVVSVFSTAPHRTEAQRLRLADAFQRLDDHPTWWGSGNHCQDWHAVLRQTRNSHAHGPALYALWS